jgi:methylglutaconyl-CoA hydratase
MHNSPQAVTKAKKLIEKNVASDFDRNLIEDTADCIAKIRVSTEGQEGLSAFLEKRQPHWVKDNWIEHDS